MDDRMDDGGMDDDWMDDDGMDDDGMDDDRMDDDGMDNDRIIYNLSVQSLEGKKNWLRTDGPTDRRTEKSSWTHLNVDVDASKKRLKSFVFIEFCTMSSSEISMSFLENQNQLIF